MTIGNNRISGANISLARSIKERIDNEREPRELAAQEYIEGGGKISGAAFDRFLKKKYFYSDFTRAKKWINYYDGIYGARS